MREQSTLGRRDFLQKSAAGAVGASSVLSAVPHLLAGTSVNSLLGLSSTDLEKLVGRTFRVNGSSLSEEQQTGTLVLKQVQSKSLASDKHRPANLRPHAVSLLFVASSGEHLVSGSHRVSGGGVPSTELFLQSTRLEGQSTESYYEAILN